eukprot:15471624-Alexandrium_andersonii.AAC.1
MSSYCIAPAASVWLGDCNNTFSGRSEAARIVFPGVELRARTCIGWARFDCRSARCCERRGFVETLARFHLLG